MQSYRVIVHNRRYSLGTLTGRRRRLFGVPKPNESGIPLLARTMQLAAVCGLLVAIAAPLAHAQPYTIPTTQSAASDDIIFEPAGTEEVRFLEGGNVGIGTTSPSQKLHVHEGSIFVTGTNPDGGPMILLGGPVAGPGQWGMEYAPDPDLNGPIQAGLNFWRPFGNANWGNYFLFLADSTGNIGIGTPNPSEKLEVSGGNALIRGVTNFQPPNGDAKLLLGDSNHYIKSVFGSGVMIGTFGVPDGNGIVLRQQTGNVGIGTPKPTAQFTNASPNRVLHVKGSNPEIRLEDSIIESGTTELTDFSLIAANGAARLISKQSVAVLLDADNNSSNESFDIITNSSYFGGGYTSLFRVNKDGVASAREIRVTLGSFPDYVFEDDYCLLPLEDLETYIKTFKHLPGVPSAKDVTSEGLSVGQMQATLLEKVEELTLHMIELKKHNASLQNDLNHLKGH